jgi:RNA polymerase sigma factor (TIGR02999 family)
MNAEKIEDVFILSAFIVPEFVPPSSILRSMTALPDEITRMLAAYGGSERDALDRLLPILYGELRRIAVRNLRGERAGHSLQPTDLVHEAYVRLAELAGDPWKNRAHFYGVAARVMRNVLVDRARARRANKRGGGAVQVTLDEALRIGEAPDVDLIMLEDALRELEAVDPAKVRVVELRYFGGLSIEETAEALGISPATVKRDWAVARAWLHRKLGGHV